MHQTVFKSIYKIFNAILSVLNNGHLVLKHTIKFNHCYILNKKVVKNV